MIFRQYRWIQASRPLSQINIAIPLVVGESLAFYRHSTFSWENAIWIHGFGILAQLFIVYTNDRLDFDADAQNLAPTLISGGSRVLQQGKLGPKNLLVASVTVAGLMLTLALYRFFGTNKDCWFFGATLWTFFLTWAYCAYPLRLSYRGHGEWLQMVGIGLVLPATGFVGQSEQFGGLLHPILLLSLAAGYCGNLLTALPDVEADRRVAKRSPAVMLGPNRTQNRLLTICTLCLLGVTTYFYFSHESYFRLALFCCWLCAALSLLFAFYLRLRIHTIDAVKSFWFSLSIANAFNALLIGTSIWLFQ